MDHAGIEDQFKIKLLKILTPLFRKKPVQSLLGRSFSSILVVRQHDQLGDMICLSPLLSALRKRFPASRIVLVTSPVNHDIMLHHPSVDEVVAYQKKVFWKNPLAFFSFVRKLRKNRFDLAVVPVTVSLSVTSDLIARFSGATYIVGASSLNGLANPAAAFHSIGIDLKWEVTSHVHQTLRNLQVLRPLDIGEASLSCTLGLTQEERRLAREFVRPMKERFDLLVGLHPGAGKPPNRWHDSHFAEVANRLFSEHHAGIFITAGPMDDIPFENMLARVRCPNGVVRNKPIRHVAAILNELDLFITNDTGLLHIAGAVSTQVLALFGPTDPLQWAPVGKKNRFIQSKDGDINSITEEQVNTTLDLMVVEILDSRNFPR
ncbi:MAG TPA: glycosyltransferase family 9 protein [Bacteroidota bacterium]|nr:glycosyltransferase family 9 protein [Bacteroidota bacterium]